MTFWQAFLFGCAATLAVEFLAVAALYVAVVRRAMRQQRANADAVVGALKTATASIAAKAVGGRTH